MNSSFVWYQKKKGKAKCACLRMDFDKVEWTRSDQLHEI